MIKIETRVKEWNHIIERIMPKEKVVERGIKPDDKVKILITRENNSLKVKDIFGNIKWKTDTKKLLTEIDKEFENMPYVEFVK